MAPNPRLSTILTLVVILAVLREGTEIIEFLNGIASSDGSTPANIALGGLIGVGMATGVSSLFYRALTCLSERLKLRLTAGMVTILAASLSLEAWNTLRRFKGTTIPGRPLWDSSPLLSETSLLGRILHTILGYTAAPTGGQMAVYVAVLVAIPTFASIVRKGKHRRD
jgi:high-affinity iron transporter